MLYYCVEYGDSGNQEQTSVTALECGINSVRSRDTVYTETTIRVGQPLQLMSCSIYIKATETGILRQMF